MRVEYRVTKEQRKQMVDTIAEITGSKPKYQGVPSCAYKVDEFLVEKDGALEFSDRTDSELVEQVLEGLEKAGFEPPTKAEPRVEPKAEAKSETKPQESKKIGLTISIPLEKVDMGNLISLLEAKGELIKKALGIKNTFIKEENETVEFPWFEEVESDEALAYTKFIASLCEMSVKQKRITAKAKDNENEKYAFRCFLLRLGFIGDEFKADRKILLSKLDGSAAFKSGVKKGGEQ